MTQDPTLWGLHAGKTGDADALFLKQKVIAVAVSAEAARHAGLGTTGLALQTTPIRGSKLPIDVVLVASAQDLLARLPDGRSVGR